KESKQRKTVIMKIDLNNILPLVRKPSRYINSEWNSIHKNGDLKVATTQLIKMCLCFPDLYELGASNLGLEILYHIINNREDALCERCFCPDLDAEEILRRENIPLFSLESQRPLIEFDIVGFSLQYELCFTNVLNMLNLARIPVWSRSRGHLLRRIGSNGLSADAGLYPLIIAGGPVCSNPKPIEEFFDFIVVGEGEDVINEIIDTVKNSKLKNLTEKSIMLNELAKIPGVYVPSIFNSSKKNTKITARTVDIKNSFYPTKPIVPYVETTHNRLNIEISRGCIHSCKFCQSRSIYHPWRERSPEEIIHYLKAGIENTGYEEVSLTSFSISNYSKIHQLLKDVSNYCKAEKISLSIPSLRCDIKAKDILPYLIQPHRANLTFGIEAGSQRLREFIGKKISDEEIYDVISYAARLGWKLIKLYFMIGLPTEEKEDIESIITLVNKLKSQIRNMKFNVTISPFVPKPHTAFQYYPMESAEVLIEKSRVLVKNLRATVKAHNVHISQLEGIFSRGDSALSKLIFTAFEKGAKFDYWHDRFNYTIWQESIKETNIDIDKYLSSRQQNGLLPWEYIQCRNSFID
ncbi:MAG: TIGR03960 family B12-binding radical SAM protein, partial [Elusimicrobiota bacterium]|nr:TIGR03960 family B12-binding radical SAM protein [Elusimicrobiota bacterium]